MDKTEIARTLREFSLLLQVKGENPFKTRAYETAALRLDELPPDRFDELAQRAAFDELPGIGEAIAKKIMTLRETGQLPQFDALRAEFPPGVLELMRVPDLGPKKIAALWRELKIGTLDELAAACRAAKVRELKGFGEKTEKKILEGIASLMKVGTRRPLAYVRPIADELLGRLRRAPGVVRAEAAGSVRRYRETVNDLDLVVAAPQAEPVFEALTSASAVSKVLGRGDTKCSVTLHDGLQVDVRVLPEESYWTALHHFTGSKAHHIRLRGLAQERGFKISEWGLERTADGSRVRVDSEAALYAALGLPYVPPELREDSGELEAALEDRLPRPVELGDLRGFLHVHTKDSDGTDSVLDMARAAKALGATYLSITDHSRSAGYAGGLDLDRLKAQWDEIDAAQEQVPGLWLMKGAEVDILEDGRLDYPDEILERLDLVVASVHSRFKMGEAEMTRRILRALENPLVHILAHPTGRLIGKREPYDIEIERILDEAAERGVAVEINGNPDRLDLSGEHARMARDRGVRLALDTDAHSVACLSHVEYAVGTARRGWVRREDVLNCLSAAELRKALRARRH